MIENKIKKMAVFCGSWYGNNSKYKQAAQELGREFVKHNITMIYGGGMFGMMGVLAKEIHDNGGQIDGITTHKIWDREHSGKFANEYTGQPLIIDGFKPRFVDDLSVRKKTIYNESNAICALPGSCGTLDELFEVIVLQHVCIIKQPIIVLNLDGFYNAFYKQIEMSIKEGFTGDNVLNAFKMVDKPQDIIPAAIEML